MIIAGNAYHCDSYGLFLKQKTVTCKLEWRKQLLPVQVYPMLTKY